MTELVFQTEDLPPAERFSRWCDMTAGALLPNILRSDHASHFLAGLRAVDLGAVSISTVRYQPLQTLRSTKLIRRSDPEGYQLMLTRRGNHRIIQNGEDVTGGPGELLLYDTSRPWSGWAHCDGGVVEGVLAQFPRVLLPLPADQVRRLTPMVLPGREGIGALLASYLTRVATDACRYQPADLPRLQGILLDLLAALLAHHLDDTVAGQPESHRHSLVLRIRRFIEQHLADPGLTPGTIAAAHHISVRYLHQLFRPGEATVAALIRTRRLDRCRRELTDPRFAAHSIAKIAARWGFSDPAHFSRAFRAAYGMPPTDYRHQKHAGQVVRSSSRGMRSQAITF